VGVHASPQRHRDSENDRRHNDRRAIEGADAMAERLTSLGVEKKVIHEATEAAHREFLGAPCRRQASLLDRGSNVVGVVGVVGVVAAARENGIRGGRPAKQPMNAGRP
jgi:hypothetical protein